MVSSIQEVMLATFTKYMYSIIIHVCVLRRYMVSTILLGWKLVIIIIVNRRYNMRQ